MMTPVLICEATRFRPSRHESIILRELLTTGFVCRERLIDQIWGQDEDGGPLTAEKCIDNVIMRLRLKLLPDLRIVVEHGRGYYLEGEVVEGPSRDDSRQPGLSPTEQKICDLLRWGEHDVDEIIAAIYPDTPQADVITRVHKYLSRLRRKINGNVERRSVYSISP